MFFSTDHVFRRHIATNLPITCPINSNLSWICQQAYYEYGKHCSNHFSGLEDFSRLTQKKKEIKEYKNVHIYVTIVL